MAKAGFFSRLSDLGTVKPLPPISGWRGVPSVSILEAVSPLDLDDKEVFCESALDYAREYLSAHKDSNLTLDEAAAINLYTQEFLYKKLNNLLRDKDRKKLVPWFRYLKLFLCGLEKIKRSSSADGGASALGIRTNQIDTPKSQFFPDLLRFSPTEPKKQEKKGKRKCD